MFFLHGSKKWNNLARKISLVCFRLYAVSGKLFARIVEFILFFKDGEQS